MTPAYRGKRLRDLGVGLVLVAWASYLWMRGRSRLGTMLCLIGAMVYVMALAWQIIISRCPRCGALVDLREPGFRCSRCGASMPANDRRPPGDDGG